MRSQNEVVTRKIAEGPTLLDKHIWCLSLNRSKDLTPSAKIVAFFIIEKVHSIRGCAYPSFETIAEANGISRRAAIKAVHDLERDGWFRVERSSMTTTGRRATNEYYPKWNRALICGENSAPVKNLHLLVNNLHHEGENFAPSGENSAPLVVNKRYLDSTDISTDESTYETTEGIRASATPTLPPRGTSQGTGRFVTEDWFPSPELWNEALKDDEDQAWLALAKFREDTEGEPVTNADNWWKSHWAAWDSPF